MHGITLHQLRSRETYILLQFLQNNSQANFWKVMVFEQKNQLYKKLPSCSIIRDIVDGIEYKKFKQNGGFLTIKDHLTLLFNTSCAYFKASELQAWLLYQSVPCLIDILPQRYPEYFASLVEGVHILLGDDITPYLLALAKDLLFLLQGSPTSLWRWQTKIKFFSPSSQ